MKKKANPTIEELQNNEDYELLAELDHPTIKEFVFEQLAKGGLLVKAYMYYQVVMIVVGIILLVRSAVLAFHNNPQPFFYILGAMAFSFTAMIIIHELLHGIAIKITGAPKVNYGAYFRKFIFFAEADRYVLNRPQFTLIAFAPLVVIKVLTAIGILLFFHHPLAYFFTTIMSVHSLFCAGDIGLLSLFYQENNAEVYTYDVQAERKSYYFKKK